MKIRKVLITIICIFFAFTYKMQSQETIISSGNEATGSGGHSSYSIGQLFFSNDSGSNGSVGQGVQHPIELITLSIEEDLLLIASTKVFPNPTTNKVHLRLELENVKNLSYQLYDIHGKLLQKSSISKLAFDIPFSHLPASLYFLKVQRNNTLLKTFKILKN